MSEINNVAQVIENNESMAPFVDMVNQIMETPESNLNPQTVMLFSQKLKETIHGQMEDEAVNQMLESYEKLHYTRARAAEEVETAKKVFNEYIEELKPSENKRAILNIVLDTFYSIFNRALERYHLYDIELPLTLEDGAQVPTYAYDTDVAADLYAADTVIVAAHSLSNMIRTGVHIGLPEGWAAYIVPRSSIGAKTPLRLSNSIGVIDSSYRGPLGVLYDNISDSDYTINKGDRIAQLIIAPSHRFKPLVVEKLDETDRGENGFGSSGK